MMDAALPCLDAGRLIGVFGAAGFGREVMPLLRLQYGAAEPFSRFVFIERSSIGEQHGVPVMAEATFFDSQEPRAFVVAIADVTIRKQLFERALESGAVPLEVRSSSSEILDRVERGSGAILCGHSTISSDTRVGLGFHLNISSYLAHDCWIGDFVTFGPHVLCAGNVIVEDNVYVGGGALIRQGTPGAPLIIGAGATIGMGAVVTKSVPSGAIMAGNPARPMRQG